MAKGGERKKTNRLLDEQMAISNNYSKGYLDQSGPERDAARGKGNEMYDVMFQGNKGLAQGSAITPELLAAIRGGGGSGGGGGGGGYSPVDIGGNGVKSSYANFMGGGGVNLAYNEKAMRNLAGLAESGGWSKDDIAKQNDIINQYAEFGKTGGLSAEDMQRMRGGGVFEDFQKTGGFTPGDISNIRTRATSVIPSMYDQAKNEANRMSNVTGGYNPAAIAQMSRTAAYDAQKAALDAELGISEQVRSGKQWGAEGGAQAEGALQGLRTGNMLQGLGGAATTKSDMLNSIAGNRIGASTGLSNADIGGQELIQRGKMFGTEGMQGLNQAEDSQRARSAANSAASNAANIANEKWLANFGVDAQLAGLGGMQDLYNSKPEELFAYDAARHGSVGQNAGIQGGFIGQRMENNPQTSWVDAVSQIGGAVAGGMTGMGGMSSMFGGGGMQAGKPVKNFKQYL